MKDDMSIFKNRTVWITGIAIFSMFFGAGNVIFPLQLGGLAGHQIGFALGGLLLTGIGAPLLGLLGAILFEGDYRRFVSRIGAIPGAIFLLLLIAAIGPFGAMPRCITVAYAAFLPYFPTLSLFSFSILSGMVILLCIAKRAWVLPILGDFLSPLLLGSLAIVIIRGLILGAPPIPVSISAVEAFWRGVFEGYQTMDLLASNLFAVSIWVLLKEKLSLKNSDSDILFSTTLAASVIGGVCLGVVYVGLSLVGAMHPQVLTGVEPSGLLSALSIHLLGPRLAIIANMAVALACLTTVIGVLVTLAEVISQEFPALRISRNPRKNYDMWVSIMVVLTVIMSNLGFQALAKLIIPLVQICYPAIIVLTLCNILYQLYGFKYVKLPVYMTLAITLCYYLIFN